MSVESRNNMIGQSFKGLTYAMALGAIAMISNTAVADDIRPAYGKPCYQTEKTYYDKDGITPFQCESAGGPAYNFTVHEGDELLWEGKLPTTEPRAYFDLPKSSESDKESGIRLVVKRDLRADPMGHAVFFGEENLNSIVTSKSGEHNIHMPIMQTIGKTTLTKDREVVTHIGKIDGAKTDFSEYIFTIRPIAQ